MRKCTLRFKNVPDKVTEIGRTTDHAELLREKMDQCVKSIKDVGQLNTILIQLADDHSIRFKGFVASSPTDCLIAVIDRGGVFTITSGGKEQHGSLLLGKGLDIILNQNGDDKQDAVRTLLLSLKRAIVQYASLRDALGVIGDRTAYLINVEPTARAHQEMRAKLLSKLDKPVFVSRPLQELFDAVDPTADTGGGSAAYSLQLDRKCFWRQASLEDRRNLDPASNGSNDRMKWVAFPAGALSTGSPFP